MLRQLDAVADRAELDIGQRINRKKFFFAVREALPADIKMNFPVTADALYKRLQRLRKQSSGH